MLFAIVYIRGICDALQWSSSSKVVVLEESDDWD